MNVLFLFQNTRGVIRAEAVCREHGLAIQVLATPRDISSECGMCLSVADDSAEAVGRLLVKEGISFDRHVARPPRVQFDMLSTVEYGGCSAKLPADMLAEALRGLVPGTDPRLLVGVDTCDDAGVFRISDDQALIVTTDFFPPICSDAYEFGQIAAANALSDVFAMGGRALLSMNLVMFPAEGIPYEVLHALLAGGQDKVREAECLTVGGHTLADYPPKYGLAVIGLVHPDEVMTNALGCPGEALVLTKPLGTGVMVAGQRLGEASSTDYRTVLDCMKQLNNAASRVAREYGVRCATDITGFGLLGHALHMARASAVTVEIYSNALPVHPGVMALLDKGCVPGAAFRNQTSIEKDVVFAPEVTYESKMLCHDPQTSGGLLFTVTKEAASACVADLRVAGCPEAAVVGQLLQPSSHFLSVR